MALFKGKEKASGNKPPGISTPKQERKVPTPTPAEKHDKIPLQNSTNKISTESKATTPNVVDTSKSKAVPIPIPTSVPKSNGIGTVSKASSLGTSPASSSSALSSSSSSSPPTSSSSSSTSTSTPTASTSGNSVKDKIANLKAASISSNTNPSSSTTSSSTSVPVSTSTSTDAPAERRKSETSTKIAALAGAVNIAALGPNATMPKMAAPKVIETPKEPELEPEHVKVVEPEKVSEPIKVTDPVISEVIKEPVTVTAVETKPVDVKPAEEAKPKRPQSARIAALGGLVNMAALGPGSKPPKPPAHVEDSNPISNGHLPTLSEEGEEAVETSDSKPISEHQPTTATVPSLNLSLTQPSDATEGEEAKPNGEEGEEQEVFADPTVMFSKRDALKKPLANSPTTQPGVKTSLLSSRISPVSLGVNTSALTASPRPLPNKSSPTSASGSNGFDATHELAKQMLALTGPDLNHVNMSRAVRPKTMKRPPSRKSITALDVDELTLQIEQT